MPHAKASSNEWVLKDTEIALCMQYGKAWENSVQMETDSPMYTKHFNRMGYIIRKNITIFLRLFAHKPGLAVTTNTKFGAHREHTHSAVPAAIILQFYAHGHNIIKYTQFYACRIK